MPISFRNPHKITKIQCENSVLTPTFDSDEYAGFVDQITEHNILE